MDFLLYFQILLGQWEGVILEIQHGYLEFLVDFYLKNHARMVKFSYLNFTPLNLYPSGSLYFTVSAQLILHFYWTARNILLLHSWDYTVP